MHDARYKLLFSHAERVEDLLRGFVPHVWVQALDVSTLEKVNASDVTASAVASFSSACSWIGSPMGARIVLLAL